MIKKEKWDRSGSEAALNRGPVSISLVEHFTLELWSRGSVNRLTCKVKSGCTWVVVAILHLSKGTRTEQDKRRSNLDVHQVLA